MKIAAVLGYTNSGKTQACNYLRDKHNYYDFHPFRFYKRFLEETYELPEGFLDTREGKEYKPEGAFVTMQEQMIEIYHLYMRCDPFICNRNLIREITKASQDRDVVIQAIRKLVEAEDIVKVAMEGEHELVVIELLRDAATPASSDDQYDAVKNYLKEYAHYDFVIDNNRDIHNLYIELESILYHVT